MEDLSPLITEQHKTKHYRPVAVAIIRNARGETLFTQDTKTGGWQLPQGGIESGENAEAGLLREIAEELGIHRGQLQNVRYKGRADLDFEPTRIERRGFTKGKRYFFFSLEYTGPSKLTVNPEEINDYRWADENRAPEVMAATRREKAELILSFLDETDGK